MKRYVLAALAAATLITDMPITAAAVTVDPNVTMLGGSITCLGADDLRRRGVDWEPPRFVRTRTSRPGVRSPVITATP